MVTVCSFSVTVQPTKERLSQEKFKDRVRAGGQMEVRIEGTLTQENAMDQVHTLVRRGNTMKAILSRINTVAGDVGPRRVLCMRASFVPINSLALGNSPRHVAKKELLSTRACGALENIMGKDGCSRRRKAIIMTMLNFVDNLSWESNKVQEHSWWSCLKIIE